MITPIIGPTYEEMLHPWKLSTSLRKKAEMAYREDPLDPMNLFNITWRDFNDKIRYFVLPKSFTGIDSNIVVLYAKDFPSGSHKVGPTYSVLVEKVVSGEVDPEKHTMVWPSTGNYGVGGAWVSSRMRYHSLVILPEEMSQERFDLIRKYGAEVIPTPGCESNVKEIYDKSHELKTQDPERIRVLNQFEAFGNYRFHYYVTGNTMVEAIKENNIGNGRVASVVLTVGSAGTIASGDLVKKVFPECKIVAGEPVQCPTLSLNGFGGHDIQGIGDKHVTWIHNVMNMDGVVQVDEMDSKDLLQLITSHEGKTYLKTFIDPVLVEFMSDKIGISGCANIIAAIKTAKYYGFGPGDNIVTVATDSISRYHSVMAKMSPMTSERAAVVYQKAIAGQDPSYFFEGDRYNRLRWHNLKYYTWVEQQGKSVDELRELASQQFWDKQAAETDYYDQEILAWRRKHEGL